MEEFQIPADPFSKISDIERKMMLETAQIVCGVLIHRYKLSNAPTLTYWPRDAHHLVLRMETPQNPSSPDELGQSKKDAAAYRQFVTDLTKMKSETDSIYFIRNDNFSEHPTMSAHIPTLLGYMNRMVAETNDNNGLSGRLDIIGAAYEKSVHANLPRYNH